MVAMVLASICDFCAEHRSFGVDMRQHSVCGQRRLHADDGRAAVDMY